MKYLPMRLASPLNGRSASARPRSLAIRRLAAGWVTAGIAAVCLALGAATAFSQGTLRVIPHASLRILDPIWTSAYISRNHGYLIYDTLFAMDEHFAIRPQMVDTYRASADGLTWHFTLRKGLKWHDGTPVTARDCVASIRRWAAKDPLGQQMIAHTRSLEATSGDSFTLTLKEPFGLVLQALGKPSAGPAFMMPERVALTDPEKQIEDTTGSGPFKFVKTEFVPGVKAVYVKNPDYLPRPEPASFLAGGKRVYLDRVEWSYVPDYNTALSAVAAGEMDYLEAVPPDLTSVVAGNPNVRVLKGADGQLVLRVNHAQPPFNNVKLRRALYYLIDQNQYMQATVGGAEGSKPCWAMFVCGGIYETNAGAEDFKPDLAKFKRLLAESGYRGEKVVVLDPTDMYTSHNPAQVTAQLLRQAGMNVELQAMDWSTALTRITKKEPVAEGGWSIFQTFFASVDQLLPASNRLVNGACEKALPGWYCDPRIEDLRDAWTRATDPARQKALAAKIQVRAYDQGAYYLLGQINQVRVVSTHVSGMKGPIPVFWDVRKE
jgi:peptide/nickel transport system substrate-binding protein